MRKYGPNAAEHKAKSDDNERVRALEKELKRVTEERDILKKAAVYFASQSN
jgi:transposase